MFSIYDRQTGGHLHSGRNSKTKKDAINGAIEFLYADGAACAPSQIRRLSLVKKEDLIKSHDLLVDEHESEIEEFEEVE